MDIVGIIITFGMVLVSLILHELSHGVMAYWLGDTTAKEDGRLTLNPVKHLDPYMSILLPMMLYIMNAPVMGAAKPVPIDTRNLKWREWGMALVAVAGPLMNLILAFLGFLVFRFGDLGISEYAFQFMSVNLSFMIFNLLPIPPLDGSRVLYAIAPDGVRGFLNTIETTGLLIVYAIIFLAGNFFSNYMFWGMNGVFQFFVSVTGG